MNTSPTLRLGTRGSPLARWQADWIAERLRAAGFPVELVYVATQGDVRGGPIGSIGGQGVFTKEIQRALLDERIDLAVHSLKDLPTEVVAGLTLAAVPARESPWDALVAPRGQRLDQLPSGARVGTGSLRRRAQLLAARPDLDVADVRGNVETRLRKLDDGSYDALVLAEAGLRRLGLAARLTQLLDASLMLPAIGQGALGVETRAGDESTRQAVAPLDDRDTRQAVVAERALLATLRGGCLAPIGAHAALLDGQLQLTAVVLSPDGRQRLWQRHAADPSRAASLGKHVAQLLVEQGAAELIRAAR